MWGLVFLKNAGFELYFLFIFFMNKMTRVDTLFIGEVLVSIGNKTPPKYRAKVLSKVFIAKYCKKSYYAWPNTARFMAKIIGGTCMTPFWKFSFDRKYLERYIHKLATNNHRMKRIDDQKVIIEYKDYLYRE